MMKDLIEIGAVARPQGIRGALKIRLFADSFRSVEKITRVSVDGKEYEVESILPAEAEIAILRLVGLDDRNAAELLRGQSVFAEKEEIVRGEGKYFISDVIGCDLVLSSGKILGKITDVQKGNVDYYYIQTAEGNAVFPLIPALEAHFSIGEKKVTVNAAAFTEVVLYEN